MVQTKLHWPKNMTTKPSSHSSAEWRCHAPAQGRHKTWELFGIPKEVAMLHYDGGEYSCLNDENRITKNESGCRLWFGTGGD